MSKANPRTIVITGASDGVGKSTAVALAGQGERVVLVGRSAEKTRALAQELDAPYYVVDFGHLDQVRQLAHDLTARHDRIDVLLNNAGGIFRDRSVTADGFEYTMQVNYYAHALLTLLLMPVLERSRAKVIQTASVSARLFGKKFDVEDINMERGYSTNNAYGNSKVALILFTRELDRRFRDRGISTVSFHPGNLATNFAAGSSSWFRFAVQGPLKRVMPGADVGRDAALHLINGTPGSDWSRGEYYEDDKVATKVNPKSADKELAKVLWDKTMADPHFIRALG